MVAYKAAQAANFINNPKPSIAAALVYGPDASLAGERARALCQVLAKQSDPPAEIVRIDERDLSENPDLLAIELQTPSLFADRRIIHVRGESRLNVARLEELMSGPLEAQLVVEAGNLRPSSPIRKLFERLDACAALPCYADSGRDMEQVVTTVLGEAGIDASRETRTYLMSRLGSDLGVARRECEKLATYIGKDGELTANAVDAVVGDVGTGLTDALAAAVAEGRATQALHQLDALYSSGQSAHGALAALSRHFQRLHRVCAAIEAGTPPKSAVSGFRPPLHFKLQDALVAQARKWSEAGAARALERVNGAVKATRTTPRLEIELAERLVLSLQPR